MSAELVIAAVIGLVFGTAVAFINSRISRKMILSEKNTFLAIGNLLRFVLDAAALALGFLVCRFFYLNVAVVLLSIAVGLTLGGILFLVLMTRRITEEAQRKMAKQQEASSYEDSGE